MLALKPSTFEQAENNPVGIESGQHRRMFVIMGNWYSHLGEWLGEGSLSVNDIVRLCDELERGQAIIITNGLLDRPPSLKNLETQKLVEVAYLVLVRRTVYQVWAGRIPDFENPSFRGLPVTYIHRQEVEMAIRGGRAALV